MRFLVFACRDESGPFTPEKTESVLLYDAQCEFCRWSLAWVLTRTPPGRWRACALQSGEAKVLLADLSEDERMASIHVLEDERLVSGGAAAAAVLRTVPRWGWTARVMRRFPSTTDRAYFLVARNRHVVGRLVSKRARRAAGRALEDHRLREQTRDEHQDAEPRTS